MPAATGEQPYRAWGGHPPARRLRIASPDRKTHVDGGAGHGITLGGRDPAEVKGGFQHDADGRRNPTVTLTDRNLSGYVQDARAGQPASARHGAVDAVTQSGCR
jgi:hypothetical protein